MSAPENSDEEWVPHPSDTESDDTLEEEYSDEISSDDEQVVSDGWELLSDPFIDVQAA